MKVSKELNGVTIVTEGNIQIELFGGGFTCYVGKKLQYTSHCPSMTIEQANNIVGSCPTIRELENILLTTISGH